MTGIELRLRPGAGGEERGADLVERSSGGEEGARPLRLAGERAEIDDGAGLSALWIAIASKTEPPGLFSLSVRAVVSGSPPSSTRKALAEMPKAPISS